MCLGMVVPQTTASLDNALTLVLGTAGLTQATARFDPAVLGYYREGSFGSGYVDGCMQDPWSLPFMMEVVQADSVLAAGQPYRMVALASRLTMNGSRRDLLGNPAQGPIDRGMALGSMAAVVVKLRQKGWVTGSVPDLTNVPVEVQRAAAIVLEAALENESYVSAAFGSEATKARLAQLVNAKAHEGANPLLYREWLAKNGDVDLAFLFAGGQDLAAAVSAATGQARQVDPARKYSWKLDTTYGQILLRGGADETTADAAVLVCIDTGGNDTAINVPTQRAEGQWLSVWIDTAGNDFYVSDKAGLDKPVSAWPNRAGLVGKHGCGSARFGITFLVDTQGNDVYRSAAEAFGSATYGLAYLLDEAGDDTYDCYANGIGFGTMGIGIVEDLSGTDKYNGFTQVQGVGLVGGVGWVVDRAGDDTYVAEDKVLDFPSPQTAEHNVSMSQGAGNGTRLDYVNGRSLAGGVGLLFDLRGNDSYSCGVFGQGCGYWMGLGGLWDAEGNDRYQGVWYVQGSAAHFAAGFLRDDAGDDVYVATTNMSNGAGHDFSIGFFIDGAGSDSYTAGSLSLGAGNANGFGIFADMLGSDSYTSVGTTLGRANETPQGSLRKAALCLGLFYDGEGNDTYQAGGSGRANNERSSSKEAGRGRDKGAVGIFYDR